jgi:exodeoxyribonuclease VII large subunit
MTNSFTGVLESQNDELTILTVEQLNLTIKQLLEGEVGTVWVQGEISNFKAHTSGHFYFSLKDSRSQISAVMFRGHNSRLKFKPADGMEVIVRGRISVYEPRGSYQILCETMEPVGVGALQKAFEQLREKLKLEGLFEQARKKPIPAYPQHVAIVTSPTGAAIRDILNILSRRAPHLQVTLVPALVQGEGAPTSLRDTFQKAQKLPNVDVIIIGRGGGSIEDLWGFNDEKLARLIAASAIPVISAVGHEIDFTIADFVADLRAPTPSAAAELVARSHQEILTRLEQLVKLLSLAWFQKFSYLDEKTKTLSRLLVDPKRKLQDLILRNDDLFDRLSLALLNLIKHKNHQVALARQKLKSPTEVISEKRKGLEVLLLRMNQATRSFYQEKTHLLHNLMSMMNSLSPLQVVERGYSIVMKNKKVVRSYKELKSKDELIITLAEGQAEVVVQSVTDLNLIKENPWNSKKSSAD